MNSEGRYKFIVAFALALASSLMLLFWVALCVLVLPKLNAILIEQGVANGLGASRFLMFCRAYLPALLLGAAAVWGLFEWRNSSMFKSWMRLASLSIVTFGLTCFTLYSTGFILISLAIAIHK